MAIWGKNIQAEGTEQIHFCLLYTGNNKEASVAGTERMREVEGKVEELTGRPDKIESFRPQ